ncbi:helix-turn-helix domain-containing protein [Thiomicrospira sp. S5]|jgi:putative transcriptional regulator|uniref:helix-turn-helix domain-containing protein n=1 Tax=Thiomicrospira sp. S5 TaxID=1803865 RepID=UPI0004A6D476|nr:helix-turn-helix transcriptional regulator [Thiomicrospira sp. S5]AZR81092.1 Cro/Cl family transcriptional regulator [Thiomicrospira sp. S5]
MIQSKLSVLMGERRMKVIDVARELGIKRNAIDLLYKDESKRIDIDLLDQLCDLFGCTPNDILHYEKSENNED